MPDETQTDLQPESDDFEAADPEADDPEATEPNADLDPEQTIPLDELTEPPPTEVRTAPATELAETNQGQTLPDETIQQTEFDRQVESHFGAAGIDLDTASSETSLKTTSTCCTKSPTRSRFRIRAEFFIAT